MRLVSPISTDSPRCPRIWELLGQRMLGAQIPDELVHPCRHVDDRSANEMDPRYARVASAADFSRIKSQKNRQPSAREALLLPALR